MKVENIHRHTVSHIWIAYVKKLLRDNPEYYTKERKGSYVPKYSVYNMVNGKAVCIIDYERFRYTIVQFLERAKFEIISGNSITIPHCGRIAANRIERDFRSKRKAVDWKKSMESGKNPETGKMNKIYYFTNDDYSRIAWFKVSHITNITMYEFIPTSSGVNNRDGGFKTELSDALKLDPYLKYRYLFSPITEYVLTETEQETIDHDISVSIN